MNMQVMNDSVKYQILFHTEVFNSMILTLPIKKIRNIHKINFP